MRKKMNLIISRTNFRRQAFPKTPFNGRLNSRIRGTPILISVFRPSRTSGRPESRHGRDRGADFRRPHSFGPRLCHDDPCGPEVRHCSLATGAPVRHCPGAPGRRRKPVGSNASNPSLFFFYVVPAPEGRLKGLPVAVRVAPPAALKRPAGASRRKGKRNRGTLSAADHGLAPVARVHAAPTGLQGSQY